MKWRLLKLAQYMRGWMGYFGISRTYKVILEMDHWIRRRLRCCYWFRACDKTGRDSEPEQEWKTIRNRIRNLLKLGANRRNAILHGFWHMSKTPTVNEALSNDWLSAKGLLSLKELWIKIHDPTTVR